MRRSVIATALGCVTLAAGTGVPASLAMHGSASGSRLAAVKLTSCSPDRRRAVFTGRMTRVAGTERMAMRFTLLAGNRHRGWSPMRIRRLARWHASLPGVRTLVYRQRLRGLPTGSSYRVRVRFRWYSTDGDVILRARRRSRSCRVPGPRPNLQVLGIRQLSQYDGGQAAYYRVRVGNRGLAAASAAPVTLFVDGAAVDTLDAGHLEPGQDSALTFVGPNCARSDSPVAATADPNDQIRESSEQDNTLSAICDAIR